MIRNYFKVAWRNITNNKGYSAINILGLSAGMAVAMLIALWVVNEYAYDRFLPDNNRLYRVMRNFESNGDTLTFNTVSLKLSDVLRNEIPEMEYVCEADWLGTHGLMAGDRKVVMDGGAVQQDFLKAFQFPLLQGKAETVFQDPSSIVLTKSAAATLFGKEDPMGKIVRLDNRDNFRVTGILRDLPANSTFQFKYLFPFSYYDQTVPFVKNSRSGGFANNAFQIFVKLKAGINSDRLASKIAMLEKREKGNTNAEKSIVILQALNRWHLFGEYKNGKNTGGFIDYVRIFSVIGILVLIIACINFVNLTTARSAKRGKEVGIRKAIGSQRSQLVMQFLAESLLLSFMALICSLLMVWLLLPAFNSITGTAVQMPAGNVGFWGITLLCVVLTGIAAGLKPAFYLSSFNPVRTLKGAVKTGRSAVFSRRALVVVQFTCSIALVISTLVIYRQMQYAKERPTGYDADRLVMSQMSDDLNKHYDALKSELLQSGLVSQVARSSSAPTTISWHSDLKYFPGKLPGETVEMGMIVISNDYFTTMGMKLLSGRDYTQGQADSNSVILNEAAVKRLRLKDPLNAEITRGESERYRVIGVVRNALMLSPFQQADPTMFTRTNNEGEYLLYRLAPGVEPHKALAGLETIFGKYNPAYPYVYEFVDKVYNSKFHQEMLTGRLSGIFAILAIAISCLGLLGLAAYMAEQRTKEIGVRKVLGASIVQVWFLLSRDFIVLVLISCLIASPLALYFLQHWLAQYEYRINIGPGVFLVAAVMALLITLCTISFQAIRAAVANPVKSLRTE
ncbi:ABC transporter permease [Chitinophaga flava]|uniref:ABC transporter permease n=1 Tax=Chitinophaga flava TaxID=2259036 RepID=A0A365XVA2_9BACT|nr:ABC transporter permease [Chitinophaga flava]RBL90028.1 ABC transporter permease [Chitinophaga flava]